MRGFRHVRYWIFSLLSAVMLWTVANSTSPVERPFDVPVETTGVPEGLVVISQDYDRVNIRVRGSRAGLASLTATDLVYVADLSSAEPGRNHHEVDVTTLAGSLPRGADVVSRAPLSIDFVLEEKQTRSVAIRLDVTGEPAEGFRVVSTTLSPERATVTGARTEVLGLKEVPTEKLDISGARAPIQRRVKLVQGGRHVWLDGIEEIEVRIDIEPIPPDELAASQAEGKKR